eukprot:TRINITY_DN20609_c0_g1_i6.p1 TRINITY_DN20609_c0_g1~~TRINITY_DN20609_c0_g1_i6.p1  ORF type:complete len:331 (+),score=36.08 TRINITY_DN20609_c0_g1_i6:1-993(+)
MSIPFIIAFFLFAFSMLNALLLKWKTGRPVSIWASSYRALQSLITIVLSLYILLVSTSISPFDCKRNGTDSYFLRADPGIKCYDLSWNKNIAISVLFCLCYVVVLPCLLCYFFWKVGRNIAIRDSKFMLKYRSLIHLLSRSYRKPFFYWELMLILKRLTFSLSSQFLLSNVDPTVRVWVSLLSLYVFGWLEVWLQPFRHNSSAKAAWSICLVLILLCQGFVFQENSSEANIATFGFVAFVVGVFTLTVLFNMVSVWRSISVSKKFVLITDQIIGALSPESVTAVFTECGADKLMFKGELEVDMDTALHKRHPKQSELRELELLLCRESVS